MAKKAILSTLFFTLLAINLVLWPYLYMTIKDSNAAGDDRSDKVEATDNSTEVSGNESLKTDNPKEAYKKEYLKKMLELDDEMAILLDKVAKLAITVGDGELSGAGYELYMFDEIYPEFHEITNSLYQLYPPQDLFEIHEHYIDMIESYNQAFSESVAAIKTGDMSKLTSYNELLAKAQKSQRKYNQSVIPLIKAYEIDVGPPIDFSVYNYSFEEPYGTQQQNDNQTIEIEIIQYPPSGNDFYGGGGTFNLPPGIDVKRW